MLRIGKGSLYYSSLTIPRSEATDQRDGAERQSATRRGQPAGAGDGRSTARQRKARPGSPQHGTARAGASDRRWQYWRRWCISRDRVSTPLRRGGYHPMTLGEDSENDSNSTSSLTPKGATTEGLPTSRRERLYSTTNRQQDSRTALRLLRRPTISSSSPSSLSTAPQQGRHSTAQPVGLLRLL